MHDRDMLCEVVVLGHVECDQVVGRIIGKSLVEVDAMLADLQFCMENLQIGTYFYL